MEKVKLDDLTSCFSDNKVILYHGSNCIVKDPKIIIQGYPKDFGHAFYCTNLFSQAKKWAITRSGPSIVNKYEYIPDNTLKILKFPEMSEEWLDFLVACRRDMPHDFDIVEGPMGDDQIWDYVDDFAKGIISRAAFWELAKFKHPTHQVAFCTDASIDCITFTGALYV